MAGVVHTHKGELVVVLNLTSQHTVLGVPWTQRLGLKQVVLGVVQGIRPGVVTQPVANNVLVTLVQQDRNVLVQQLGHVLLEWSHFVTVENEVSEDSVVTAGENISLGSNGLLDKLEVQVLVNVVLLDITIAAVRAVLADVVWVQAGLAVRAKKSLFTVQVGWNTSQGVLSGVACLGQNSAKWVVPVHLLTLFGGQNWLVATLTAHHGSVVLKLDQGIGDTVTNQNRGQFERTVGVVDNLRSECGDVVASVRFTSNVELVLDELRELLEEELQEDEHILGGSSGGVDLVTLSVGVADADWLVQENHRSVVVPGVWVERRLQSGIDGRRTQFEKQAGGGRAAWTAVQPQDHWVILWVVSGLKEPVEEVLLELLHIQVTSVLLDSVQAQNLRVGLLGSQGVAGELAVGLDLKVAAQTVHLVVHVVLLHLFGGIVGLGGSVQHICTKISGQLLPGFQDLVLFGTQLADFLRKVELESFLLRNVNHILVPIKEALERVQEGGVGVCGERSSHN